MKILTLILLLPLPAFAFKALNLHTSSVQILKPNEVQLALYITENCSVCESQIKIIQNCLDTKNIVAFIPGDDEEKLKRLIRRKRIQLPTYQLNDEIKQTFAFGAASPAIAVRTNGQFKLYEGLQDCAQIKKLLN